MKKYHKVIIFCLVVCNILLAVMFYSVSQMLYYSDLSEYMPQQPSHKFNNVYLVTYASGDPLYASNRRFLSYSAIRQNIQHILKYSEADIDQEFYNKHKDIFNIKAGAGLWLWKPYVIQKTLNLVPENSYVIYADSGFVFHKDLTPLLELAKKHQLVLVTDANQPLEYDIIGMVSSRTVLQKTNCDSLKCRKAPHLMAGFGIYKNTPEVRKFVNRWLAYCENHDLIIGKNLYPHLKQHPEYKRHQQDQTLLGITNFQENIGQYILPISEWRKYVINVHRDRSIHKLFPSLLPLQLRAEKVIRGIFKHIYKHTAMVRLRYFLFKSSK